jgi:hypothetical protein
MRLLDFAPASFRDVIQSNHAGDYGRDLAQPGKFSCEHSIKKESPRQVEQGAHLGKARGAGPLAIVFRPRRPRRLRTY